MFFQQFCIHRCNNKKNDPPHPLAGWPVWPVWPVGSFGSFGFFGSFGSFGCFGSFGSFGSFECCKLMPPAAARASRCSSCLPLQAKPRRRPSAAAGKPGNAAAVPGPRAQFFVRCNNEVII